ncbi:SDR family oxidoreductase [Alteromonadaceae bacterium M269]|nr:SDR family oxidoreductase [Alteromonadaceae bacterium M269]
MTDLMNDPAQLFNVEGKRALITGATGAFGRVAATILANAGCKVAIAGGNKNALENLSRQLTCRESDVVMINQRPSTLKDCQRIVDLTVEAFGGLDILVVASGMNDVDPIENMSEERWQTVMDANVKGSWLMCKAAGAQMIEQGQGGKVVLVSSARGKLGHAGGYSAYCPSKSAVDGITRALGCEWGPHNISVNAIAPTVFRSNLTAWMFSDDEPGKSVREGMLSRIPMGRLGEPEDLAGPLLFLASAASNFHTGHVIYADGGYTAG